MNDTVSFSETTGGNKRGILPQSPRCPGCGCEFHTIMSFPTVIFERDVRKGLTIICEGTGYMHYRDENNRNIYMYAKGATL